MYCFARNKPAPRARCPPQDAETTVHQHGQAYLRMAPRCTELASYLIRPLHEGDEDTLVVSDLGIDPLDPDKWVLVPSGLSISLDRLRTYESKILRQLVARGEHGTFRIKAVAARAKGSGARTLFVLGIFTDNTSPARTSEQTLTKEFNLVLQLAELMRLASHDRTQVSLTKDHLLPSNTRGIFWDPPQPSITKPADLAWMHDACRTSAPIMMRANFHLPCVCPGVGASISEGGKVVVHESPLAVERLQQPICQNVRTVETTVAPHAAAQTILEAMTASARRVLVCVPHATSQAYRWWSNKARQAVGPSSVWDEEKLLDARTLGTFRHTQERRRSQAGKVAPSSVLLAKKPDVLSLSGFWDAAVVVLEDLEDVASVVQEVRLALAKPTNPQKVIWLVVRSLPEVALDTRTFWEVLFLMDAHRPSLFQGMASEAKDRPDKSFFEVLPSQRLRVLEPSNLKLSPFWPEPGWGRLSDALSVVAPADRDLCWSSADRTKLLGAIHRGLFGAVGFRKFQCLTSVSRRVRRKHKIQGFAARRLSELSRQNQHEPCAICLAGNPCFVGLFLCGHSACVQCMLRCAQTTGKCFMCRSRATKIFVSGKADLRNAVQTLVASSGFRLVAPLLKAPGKRLLLVQTQGMMRDLVEVLGINRTLFKKLCVMTRRKKTEKQMHAEQVYVATYADLAECMPLPSHCTELLDEVILLHPPLEPWGHRTSDCMPIERLLRDLASQQGFRKSPRVRVVCSTAQDVTAFDRMRYSGRIRGNEQEEQIKLWAEA